MEATPGAAKSSTAPTVLMSTDEAATYLNAKPLTLVAWRHKKQGPTYVKIGGHVRYRPADLDVYIAQNERRAVAAWPHLLHRALPRLPAHPSLLVEREVVHGP